MVKKTESTHAPLFLWEKYRDVSLRLALVGEFDPEADAAAWLAFTENDCDTLTKLHDQRNRAELPDFIEAPDVFAKLEKPKTKDGKNEREWTTAERYAILCETKGTRAYAHKLIAT